MKVRFEMNVGFQINVIPSERSESRDLHLRLKGQLSARPGIDSDTARAAGDSI
jgi:hypothetical protein